MMRDLEAQGRGRESGDSGERWDAVGGRKLKMRESGETRGEIKKDRSCVQSAASCNTNAKQPKNCLFPGLKDVADYGGGGNPKVVFFSWTQHLFGCIKMFPGNNVFRHERPNFLFFSALDSHLGLVGLLCTCSSLFTLYFSWCTSG